MEGTPGMKTLRPLLVAALFTTALSLGACQKTQEPDAQPTDVESTSQPDAKPGMTASGARLILPAVPGRPGVAYFKLANGSDAEVKLAAVHIDGVGKTEMHKTEGGKMSPVADVAVPVGGAIDFAPGGLHVMAFDIGGPLQAGGETEMTLTFEGGDKLSVPVQIEAMGAMSGGAGAGH